jgi:long-chain acyl-CoA synthetase
LLNPITTQIERWAHSRPAKPALILGQQAWTYAELWNQAANAPVANDPTLPGLTINPGAAVVDQIIQALARLHNGLPIVGMTSGSTGAAKRYQRSQASWCASFASDQKEFGITPTDVVVAPGNLTHSLFSYAVIHGLYVGATVIVSDSFRPDRVLQQMKTHNATVLYGVPTQLKMLAIAGVDERCPSVRWVLSSGARWFTDITPSLQAIFPNAVIAEFYGASELSYVSLAKHGADATLPADSVGRAFDGVTIQIEPLGQNTGTGRIWVHSRGLFDGYLSPPPPDFSEKIDSAGRRWMSVGDLGYRDANDYLFLVGRESRKVVVSGKNLYPEEVEQALLSQPAIAQAAVIGVKDELRGERLLAVLQLKPNQSTTRAALIAALRAMIDDYKIPRDYALLDDWPMTASGKTDFRSIVAVVGNGRAQALPA